MASSVSQLAQFLIMKNKKKEQEGTNITIKDKVNHNDEEHAAATTTGIVVGYSSGMMERSSDSAGGGISGSSASGGLESGFVQYKSGGRSPVPIPAQLE